MKDEIALFTQRRPALARDDEWIKNFLAGEKIGRLATRWEDQPFITPTSFWYDPDNHRIIFHSNQTGRVRSNLEHFPRACFEVSQAGAFLASNAALEFTVQFASVLVFGIVRILTDPQEKREALYGLLHHCFSELEAGHHFRPITDQELAITSVYALSVETWTGKVNWPEQADQIAAWPKLESGKK